MLDEMLQKHRHTFGLPKFIFFISSYRYFILFSLMNTLKYVNIHSPLAGIL